MELTFQNAFLTAASCPKKDFYTPPLQKSATDFCTVTQNSTTFVLPTQKSTQKRAGPKKLAKKAAKKVRMGCNCAESSKQGQQMIQHS